MKNVLHVVIVVVVGSLLGTFISKMLNMWLPAGGQLASLFNTAVNTGLDPTTVDLSLVEITAGLVFKFNITSILGILLSAVAYKHLVK